LLCRLVRERQNRRLQSLNPVARAAAEVILCSESGEKQHPQNDASRNSPIVGWSPGNLGRACRAVEFRARALPRLLPIRPAAASCNSICGCISAMLPIASYRSKTGSAEAGFANNEVAAASKKPSPNPPRATRKSVGSGGCPHIARPWPRRSQGDRRESRGRTYSQAACVDSQTALFHASSRPFGRQSPRNEGRPE
jgi:hypothetical protein